MAGCRSAFTMIGNDSIKTKNPARESVIAKDWSGAFLRRKIRYLTHTIPRKNPSSRLNISAGLKSAWFPEKRPVPSSRRRPHGRSAHVIVRGQPGGLPTLRWNHPDVSVGRIGILEERDFRAVAPPASGSSNSMVSSLIRTSTWERSAKLPGSSSTSAMNLYPTRTAVLGSGCRGRKGAPRRIVQEASRKKRREKGLYSALA